MSRRLLFSIATWTKSSSLRGSLRTTPPPPTIPILQVVAHTYSIWGYGLIRFLPPHESSSASQQQWPLLISLFCRFSVIEGSISSPRDSTGEEERGRGEGRRSAFGEKPVTPHIPLSFVYPPRSRAHSGLPAHPGALHSPRSSSLSIVMMEDLTPADSSKHNSMEDLTPADSSKQHPSNSAVAGIYAYLRAAYPEEQSSTGQNVSGVRSDEASLLLRRGSGVAAQSDDDSLSGEADEGKDSLLSSSDFDVDLPELLADSSLRRKDASATAGSHKHTPQHAPPPAKTPKSTEDPFGCFSCIFNL